MKEYEKNKYPDKQSVNKIASKVNLTSKQVCKWFTYNRQKLNESKSKIIKFNEKTRKALIKEYEKNKYPNKQYLDRIASKVDLTYKQVSSWFKHRREKLKETNNKNFNSKITNSLLKEYEKNKYPSKQSFDRIASKLNLTFEQVSSWFKYKRNKLNESKTKKVKFSETATKALFKEYGKNKYPDKKSLNRIASLAGLTFNQVVSWFKHKRNRNK